MGIIESRDTIIINGIPHTRWSFSYELNLESYIEEFIMGIGNSKGLFNLLAPDLSDLVSGATPLNICYTDNSQNTFFAQEIYNEFTFGELDICFLMTGGLNDQETSFIELYPNPGKDEFRIRREQAGESTLIIRDISGKEHLNTSIFNDIEVISTQFLSSGLYIIEVISDSENLGFTRWVKQ